MTPYDAIFERVGRWFDLPPFLLKAVAGVESSWLPRAYRYEPVYWDLYMKDKPLWAGRDPKEVSASYGLCQTMYDLAFHYYPELKSGEELYNPELNVEIAGEYLRDLRLVAATDPVVGRCALDPVHVALARYNGGGWRNPGLDGKLRNQVYVDKVLTMWGKVSG